MRIASKEMRRGREELKQQIDGRFHIVFATLDHLLAVEARPKRKIGFTAKEKRTAYAVNEKRGGSK